MIATRAARLCLFGPPGTGKTAYARWLAQQLDMPLLVKRGSDLLGPYVGQNEQNIARAFRNAEADGAVLLIDEVDGFLQDRRGASKSWEQSMVNEMLTQMEAFSGIFIASTNLIDSLDPAALRRFDLKVKFDFMRAEQAWALMRRYCTELALPPLKDDLQANLKVQMARLTQLTPGDFALVRRQHRFRPIQCQQQLLSDLAAECAVKTQARRVIGFL